MYSAVLMAALTTGAESPQWGYYYYPAWGCYPCCSYYGCYDCWWGYPYWYGCYSYSCYPYWNYWYTPVVAAAVPVVRGVVVQPAPVVPAPPKTFVGPRPTDPTVTPLSEAEREAVRRVLEMMRKKAQEARPPDNVAKVTVHLPAEARLYVDEVLCNLASGTRSFTTPTLEPGRSYFYTLRMEVNRGGQTVTESRRVTVTTGKEVEVDFHATATAASR